MRFVARCFVTAPVLRAGAVAVVFGAALLVAPVHAARAQAAEAAAPADPVDASPPAHHARGKAHWAQHETIEQRITALHASLKITTEEEPQWAAVAQTMRDNEAAMQKLGADSHATPPEGVTALDDLKAYQTFAQAHVDGLVKLNATFTTLYMAMPDAQKKVADEVFMSFGHKGGHGHG
jgi:hypothetical protein